MQPRGVGPVEWASMSNGRLPRLILDVGQGRLRAVQARAKGKLLEVEAVSVRPLPDDLDASDASAVGSWVREVLKADGVRRGSAVVALTRDQVVLKRLQLPSTHEYELVDMARLAVQRELPFSIDEAVIDYVVLEQSEGTSTLLVVAAARETLGHVRKLVKSAGLSLSGVTLRGFGMPELVRTLSAVDVEEPRADGTFIVDLHPAGAEFALMGPDFVHMARAATFAEADSGVGASGDETDAMDGGDTPSGSGGGLDVETLLTETRRTWMSFRLAGEGMSIRSTLLLGDPSVVSAAEGPLSATLDVPLRTLSHHPLVKPGSGVAPEDLRSVWPLTGLYLHAWRGRPGLNLASPRKAPDPRAAIRRRVVFGAAAVLLLGFGLWTTAVRELERLETEAAELREQVAKGVEDFHRAKREFYQVEHLKRWEAVDAQWLDHLRVLRELSPPRDRVVLDGWRGDLDFRGVEYDHRATGDEPKWRLPLEVTIIVEGEAQDRATADALRAELVRTELYTTSSTGADRAGGRRLPFGFTYRLRTRETSVSGVLASMASGEAGSVAAADGKE